MEIVDAVWRRCGPGRDPLVMVQGPGYADRRVGARGIESVLSVFLELGFEGFEFGLREEFRGTDGH